MLAVARCAAIIFFVSVALPSCSNDEPADALGSVAKRLLVLEELGPPQLTTVDLETSATTPTWAVASGGFAYELDVHDQTGEILLAHTAPASSGAGYDRSQIVRIDTAGKLHHVACPDVSGSWCFYPRWGADSVWFIRHGDGVSSSAEPTLWRRGSDSGALTEIATGATEPAIAADSSAVAWIAVDPADGRRSLVLADASGQVIRTLVAKGPDDLGQPFFSADGRSLYFIRIAPIVLGWTGRVLNWLIPTASAHGVHDKPADWWQVSVDGGEPTQLTHLNTIHYDGRADRSGTALYVATREGVQRIDPSTGEATLVLKTRTVRALDWLPDIP